MAALEHIGIRVERAMKDKLIEIAKKEDRTLSNYLVRIFRQLIEDDAQND